MEYKDLTPEQREKVDACTTAEELVELTMDEGISLTDEQLETISGGSTWKADGKKCPACGSKNGYEDEPGHFHCTVCNHIWQEEPEYGGAGGSW